MRKFARLGTITVLVTALLTIAIGSPAEAATNPYTPQQACSNQFGGSWSTTTDGHRNMVDPSGDKWGDIYLMYNSATGYNCVATIKSVYVGTLTETEAGLLVKPSDTYHEDDNYYRYYAAVQAYANNTCVQYIGFTTSVNGVVEAYGGRNTWGNCG